MLKRYKIVKFSSLHSVLSVSFPSPFDENSQHQDKNYSFVNSYYLFEVFITQDRTTLESILFNIGIRSIVDFV